MLWVIFCVVVVGETLLVCGANLDMVMKLDMLEQWPGTRGENFVSVRGAALVQDC